MLESHEELEAQLLVDAQSAIRAMLAKKKPAEAITLSEIEQLVGEMGQRIEQKATQVLAKQAQQVKGARPTCPTCGALMRDKGSRRKQVVTLCGEIEIERVYYYCLTCQRGLFPPR